MKKDILKHKLVPDHTILSKTEANKVLKQLNIHQEQLPKIKSDDPVVKEIGAKPDDILKMYEMASISFDENGDHGYVFFWWR